MPFDAGAGTTVPTFSGPINTQDPQSNTNLSNGYPLGSLNRDEADEMNLYVSSPNDSPFGPEDLEWLYRGARYRRRLAHQPTVEARPISFMASADALTRRRMFSTDSWETTNFVYAHDNPGNVFPANSRFLSGIHTNIASPNILTNGDPIPPAWCPSARASITRGSPRPRPGFRPPGCLMREHLV